MTTSFSHMSDFQAAPCTRRGFCLRLVPAQLPVALQQRQRITLFGGVSRLAAFVRPQIGHCAALGKRFDIDRIALVTTQHHQVALLILPNDKADMPATLPLEYHDAAIRRFRQTGSAVHPGFRPILFFRNIPAGCLQTVADKRSAPRRFGVAPPAFQSPYPQRDGL